MSQIEFRVRKARLGKNPEVFESKKGSVVKLALAVNHYKKVGKEWEETGTTWLHCTAFGDRADEVVALELEKGDQVYVTGQMKESSYEDEDGETKYSKDFYIEDLFKYPPKEYEDEDDDDERPRKKSTSTAKKKTGIQKKPLSKRPTGSSSKKPVAKKKKIRFV